MNFRRDYRSFDFVLAFLVLAMAVFGVVMIGSATGLGRGVVSDIFTHQILWVVTGLVLMLLAAFVDYQIIGRCYLILYVVNIGLLGLALLFGQDEDGVARWVYLSDFGIRLGFDFGIQPSEFTKIFMIIYLAKWIDKCRDRINNIFILLGIILISLVPIVMIVIQPSLSASIIPLVILVTMLFVGKVSYKYMMIGVIILIPLSIFFYYDLHNENKIILDKILEGYQIERIMKFLYGTGDTFQTDQSIKAIGGGQLLGRGLFNNPVKVPYAYNDFIFAVIGSELGFAGAVAVISVMFAVVGKCLIISYKSEIFLGKLIAAGVAAMLAFQTILNVAVAMGATINTGVVFPFMSSGGSSMWISMASVGLAINVGMTKSKPLFDA